MQLFALRMLVHVPTHKTLSAVQITAAPPMQMGPPGGNRGFGQPQFQRQ